MKTYYQRSAAQSKQFANEVNALVVRGVFPAVAMNIIRWRAKNVRTRVKKFNYDLTLEQLQGPSVRLAEKVGVKNAADPWEYEPDFVWRSIWDQFSAHGHLSIEGTLYPAHQAWFAKESYYGLPCIVTED